ncbi:MAG: pilus assembly protein PilP [Pseudomonadota bacterium]
MMLRKSYISILIASFILSGYLYPAGDDIILEDTLKVSTTSESSVNSIRRDPFYRVLEQLGLNESRSITDYELYEFMLLGTVWDITHPVAMFKGPKEKRYVLKIGDRIGKHSGVVIQIGQGEVNIEETYSDINKRRIRKSVIKRVERES